MKKTILSLVLLVWLAPSAYAQGALAGGTVSGKSLVEFIDSLTPPASNPTVQGIADLASWATWGTVVALDVRDAIKLNTPRAYGTLVARNTIVPVAVWAIKKAVHRTRPCAKGLSGAQGYDTACGTDNPDTSFLSGHTAWAFSAIGSNHRALSMSLAVGTGAGRVIGKKHWLTDVLAGAALGWGTSWIR
jgi:membrane-associated phospholipid phosphatase